MVAAAEPGATSATSISGNTALTGVIGDPVRHSLSPLLHNTAYRTLGLDWVSVAFEVSAGETAAALAGMSALGIRGLSVTMPHKTAVAALVDELGDDASALGAVNCVVATEDGRLRGENTDGAGFIDSLRSEGVDVAGMTCVVIGGGGAARAVILSLATSGAASVGVVNRTASKAIEAAALAGAEGAVVPIDAVADADLVVNATPLGMSGASASRNPVPDGLLRADQVVADLVYQPELTPLLRAAADAGAKGVGGLGMLIHQAAHALRYWTGHEPPVAEMAAAVRSRL